MEQERLFHLIKETIAVIPYGKVATVQEMADGLSVTEDDVLWAVKEITDDMIPVHRLVRDDGTLLGDIQLFDEDSQQEKLTAEGVTFTNDYTVNLSSHFWSTCEYVKDSD